MLNNELKHNPFIVPENYFDSLPSKIQEKCIENRKTSRTFGLIPKFTFAGGSLITVALALFLSLLSISDQKNSNSNSNILSEEIAIDDRPDEPSENIRAKIRKNDAMVRYLAVQNVNTNDILLARSK
ncbi:MAG: hypothetical protein LBG92_11755 [Prevotellaceae bacterium]|jgi:hypothetical protein|nr:hypothetical protein [Prevotellaceae bacterium]